MPVNAHKMAHNMGIAWEQDARKMPMKCDMVSAAVFKKGESRGGKPMVHVSIDESSGAAFVITISGVLVPKALTLHASRRPYDAGQKKTTWNLQEKTCPDTVAFRYANVTIFT